MFQRVIRADIAILIPADRAAVLTI